MSETKRTTLPKAEPRAYSARKGPSSMPIGVPMTVASATWIRLPTMAFSRPPPEPGGRVTSVKTERFNAPKPLTKSVARIEARKTRPMPVAASDRPRTSLSMRLRRRPSRAATARSLTGVSAEVAVMLIGSGLQPGAQQPARAGQHHEGQHEEDEAQRQQRRELQRPGLAFPEFQCHDRGDGIARSEQCGGDAVGVADDEGDRHRLPQRPAEAEHDAAGDRDAGIGQDDALHHLPGRAAQAIGAFLEDRRHLFED